MQTVKLLVSLPDAEYPQMALHISSNDADCDVMVELPMRSQRKAAPVTASVPMTAEDEYMLGGYAGI